MRKQASVPVVDSYWKPRFPGQIDSTLVIADELKGGVLELEGEQLMSIALGHTDTDISCSNPEHGWTATAEAVCARIP
jgi:hypothetical protein